MGPIDYSGAFPQIDIGQRFLSGLQAGAALGGLQQQQEARQLAQQQAQQYAQDVQDAMANPTPQAFSSLALRYPAQREAVKQAWDGMSAADQKSEGDTMSQAYSALLAGNTDAAKGVVQAQINARKNSGLDTSHYDNALQLLDSDPKQAQAALGFTLSHISDPKTFAQTFGTLSETPGKVADTEATVAGKQADNVLKGQQITAQKAGALAKVVKSPEQVQAFLQSEAKAGRIAPEDLATLKSTVPADPAKLPDFLNSLMTSGVKPEDQQKYLTPDANTLANNATSIRTTGMNNAMQIGVQKMIADRENSGGDAADFTPEAIDNAAKRYNLDGTLPPMGMGAAASAGRTKILNRAAELAAGVDGTDQRQNQLNVKQQQRVLQDFTSGKSASAVRSFNVGISHLDTLGNLADALGNKDTQAVNRIGNYFATQTGNPAPTNFNAAKKIVGDEIVKAIVGAGGGVHDREEAAKVIDAANSPAQLKGAINTYKELMVGQLGGLERQYQQGSNRNDFERFLSPQAQTLRAQHGGARTPAASSGPAIGTVDGGYRFRGGDPSQKSSWEKL
jgi:hypothetical protein